MTHYNITEIVEKLNIREELFRRHYYITSEYQNTDDIDDEEDTVFFIQEILDTELGEKKIHAQMAKEIYDSIKDSVIEEIYERDESESEYQESKNIWR